MPLEKEVVRDTRSSVLFLFDVDGTLTEPRGKVTKQVVQMLRRIHEVADVGLVGGSDLAKIQEQMGNDLLTSRYIDYVFAENGLDAYAKGKNIHRANMIDHLGTEVFHVFVDECYRYIAGLDLPVKRTKHVEVRNGMINVSPIGRDCSQEERMAFEAYDNEHGIRRAMIAHLQSHFEGLSLSYAIGGQISFDVYPKGWDKTYCLRFVKPYDTVLFFGDKTEPGGNDYELFVSTRTQSYSVKGPEDTVRMCANLLDLFHKN